MIPRRPPTQQESHLWREAFPADPAGPTPEAGQRLEAQPALGSEPWVRGLYLFPQPGHHLLSAGWLTALPTALGARCHGLPARQDPNLLLLGPESSPASTSPRSPKLSEPLTFWGHLVDSDLLTSAPSRLTCTAPGHALLPSRTPPPTTYWEVLPWTDSQTVSHCGVPESLPRLWGARLSPLCRTDQHTHGKADPGPPSPQWALPSGLLLSRAQAQAKAVPSRSPNPSGPVLGD